MKNETKQELLKWIFHKEYGSKEDRNSSISDSIDNFALAIARAERARFFKAVLPEEKESEIEISPTYKITSEENTGFNECRAEILENRDKYEKSD